MPTKVDLEYIVSDLKALLVANLNTKIAAIQTEKNDGMVLKTVDSNAFFIQDMNSAKALVYDPFIYLGVEDVKTNGLGPVTLKEYSIPVILVLADNGQDREIANRLYRYWRSLEETFEDGYHLLESSLKLNISSLVPISWRDENSSSTYRAVGVMVTAAIA